MPQLDKVTFLSQFFWLCVFFLGFYVVSLKFFLPQMGRVLKYRKKRLSKSDQGVSTMQEENEKVRHSTDRLLENGLKTSKEIFNQNLQRTENWLLEYTSHTNQTKLKDTNYNYLRSLGERSLSHNLSLQGGFCDFSSTVFVAVLINKLNTSVTSPTRGGSNSFASISTRAQNRKQKNR